MAGRQRDKQRRDDEFGCSPMVPLIVGRACAAGQGLVYTVYSNIHTVIHVAVALYNCISTV